MPKDPCMWGITVRQIYDFYVECNGGPLTNSSLDDTTNMYEIVQKYVKPKTAGSGQSLAVFLNSEAPKAANKFLSHAWAESFSYLVWMLCINCFPEGERPGLAGGDSEQSYRRHCSQVGFGEAGGLQPDDVIWFCCFAVDQNADIQGELGSSPLESPFAKALVKCDEVLILFNQNVNLYTRIWCVLEIYLTLKNRVANRSIGWAADSGLIKWADEHADQYPLENFTDRGDQEGYASCQDAALKAFVEEFPTKVRAASASVAKDKVDILAAVEDLEEEVDALIAEVRVKSLSTMLGIEMWNRD